MPGQRHAAVDHRNRLGSGQRGRGRLDAHALAVLGLAAAQFAEDLHHALDLFERRRLGGQRQRAPHLADALHHDLHFFGLAGGHRQHHRIEAPLERARQLVHALVAVIGRGDHREALHRLHLAFQLGHGQRLFGKHRDQRVLHVGGNARELLDACDLPALHGVDQRAGNQRLLRRAVRQQLRVVPAIAQLFFAGARRALHQQRGIAAHRRRQVLGHPRLGRARNAIQQQRAVGGQRGHGDLHEARIADVLGRDFHAVLQRATHQVLQHGPGRELPARRTRAVIDLRQRLQFVRKLLFCMLAKNLAHGVKLSVGKRERKNQAVTAHSALRMSAMKRTRCQTSP
ncbi:hypothetical protein SDC9_104094 [bioreactor metagenome]|uniref:Uncharacterized protein n=1 Tax=bioreactor metagenome TaxID=1076179 RepID=A0A645AVJ3_9ZZZZ